MITSFGIVVFALTLIGLNLVQAQSPSPSVLVTPDNFNRAETDMIFAGGVKRPGQGLGRFMHYREPMGVDYPIIRPNRDTLYSLSVFDLGAGPVTITLPDAGKRFISLQVIDEDQYTPQVLYGGGKYTFTRQDVGTRYVSLGIRILADPNSPEDIKQVHTLQDAIKVDQHLATRAILKSPLGIPPATRKCAMLCSPLAKPSLTPIVCSDLAIKLMLSAISSEPPSHSAATRKKMPYTLNITPSKNDGKTVHQLTVKARSSRCLLVNHRLQRRRPFHKERPQRLCCTNSITAKKSADGSVTVRFGGEFDQLSNCLPIAPGWNYMVRLYRPQNQILDGTWKFPEAQPLHADRQTQCGVIANEQDIHARIARTRYVDRLPDRMYLVRACPAA